MKIKITLLIIALLIGFILVFSCYDKKVIQGIPCKVGKFQVTSYYENGKLERCLLYEDIKVQNIPCKQSVILHPNGKLQSCRLYEDFNFKDISCGEQEFIEFDENGKFIECR